MTVATRRTNADVIQPYVSTVKKAGLVAVGHFRENPDELVVVVAPILMLALATRRHKLNFAESALVSEVAFWSGYFAMEAYRDWKKKPAGTVPRLREVK